MAQYETRRVKLKRLIKKAKIQALLVSDTANITYLTGFTGDASCLLLDSSDELLLSDARFSGQIAEECPSLTTLIRRPPMSMPELIGKALRRLAVRELGFESTKMTLAELESLASLCPNVQWVPTQGLVEQLRMIKDRSEIEAIRKAIQLAEQAWSEVRARFTPELTELDIVRELEYEIRKLGGRGCSFPPIVAVGSRAALPHAPPTTCSSAGQNLLLVDWGANERLYVSDLTRVFAIGRISPKLERIYRIVLRAQRRAIESIRPGVTAELVDAAARDVVESAGFGKQFGHGLGHGIGIDVHESPRLAARQSIVLQAGMVVTVEPGIYLSGWGGVRIEDDVLVTRDGHEVLSQVTRELSDCVLPN